MDILDDRLSPYKDALAQPNFRKLLIGQSFSMAGDAICLATLPIALYRNDFSGGVFGATMGAVGVGTVIGAVVGGSLADRASPKRILILTDIFRGLVQLLATLLIASGAAWWSLICVYLIFGIGIGVSRPCSQVLLVKILPKQSLIAGNGAMSFVDNLFAVLCPATLGVLIIFWDPVWGVFIDGVTFFCAAYFTALLPNAPRKTNDEGVSISDALNGLRAVLRSIKLLIGFSSTLVLNVLCFPVFLVAAPFAIAHRFSDSMWGICLAASGLGACIGSFLVVLLSGHLRLLQLAVICGLFLACGMTLLGVGNAAWMVILGATFIGVVEASWLTGWATSLQILSPEKDLGKVIALDTLVTGGLHPFVYLGSGLVGGLVGYSQILTVVAGASAVAMTFIGIFFTVFIRRK